MKYFFNNKLWIFLVIINSASLIYSSPVVDIDLDEFKDDWNYQTFPDQTPILNSGGKQHNLPPASKRQAKESPDPLQVIDLHDKTNVGNVIGEIGDSVRRKIPCSVCQLAVGMLQTNVRKGEPFELIKTKFVSLCVGFEIQNAIVCNGIIDVFGPEVLPVLNFTTSGPKEICRLALGETCEEVEIPDHQWKIDLPDVKKPEVKEVPLPKPGKPTLKVLHISDTHLDPEYAEGSIANCEEPLCCRTYSSPPKDNDTVVPAGKWGVYDKCDVPEILIENMLQNIVEKHPDIDYIIWTGDLPPHDIWNQTKGESLEILKKSVKQMQDAFPHVPILPALGNHEGIPAGSFPPPWNRHEDHSISWLYEEVNRQWKDWLPASEENTILHGGFYSVLIRPGFRLISLNMNYCHSLNWWLLVNSTDPAKELKWLVHQLQQAEDNGEKVHIIGHIPPGVTDCLKTWSENYYEIINRYENTVVAQFFGHTHADEFEVFYDNDNYKRPTSIAYIGPSVTPFNAQNPAYRIYYVDGEHDSSTWEVIDHETWIMDLQKANDKNEENPVWYKLYSAREDYEMPNLRPKEWNSLIYRMVGDKDLFQRYFRNYHRDSPMSPKYEDQEKLQLLCDLKSGKSQERLHLCHDLESSWDSLARYHYKTVENKNRQCTISPTSFLIFLNIFIVSRLMNKIFY
ncbi:hypothetical protein ILUMI_06276 [Ignelater luminosus]|uniref:Sphingomyelin phosphodiesterase n=1 Tax=Ignelater luminosus TaxID=2038154 RepID=A0A8K0DAB1_IGNLU|nr:hypothetical protein ILUMI_06276 [Ignelater luminosus]